MARIITVLHFFAAVFLGFGLAFLGVPVMYSWPVALVVVGIAAMWFGRTINEREAPGAPPSLLTAIGYGFVLVFAPLVFAGGASSDGVLNFPLALGIGLAAGIALVAAYRFAYKALRGKANEPQGPAPA
ncbi:hypothetical protein [Glycomyces terrestris]|uniref:Uncharacterized protein n=1 Tax=Glycomyces terrestris TaxID=2493553 RepID=A0A426UVA0_9ACTN|nr:hypothetical protein [Glycomyces terrestris]RRR98275.1 hypothetical protein EIW28_15290 [Glycomyces terrestris]